MKQTTTKLKSNILLWTILSFLLFYGCSTLQKQKGFEHYTKNTDWKVRKL